MSDLRLFPYIIAAALLLAIGLGFLLARPDPLVAPVADSPSSSSLTAHHRSVAPASPPDTTAAAREERPFWEDAVVPDAGERIPTAAVIPKRQSPIIHRDYEAEVRTLENGGSASELNDSLLLWFNSHPIEATEWINQTGRFEDLVPSLHSLALGIANQGQLDTALAWVEAIPDEAARHETLMRIYAQEAQQRRVTAADLQEAGFAADDITSILSGALND